MDNLNLNKHISGQFNAELEYIRTQVMTMGGLVEQQLSDAITAMQHQPLLVSLESLGRHTVQMLHDVLDAFARMDLDEAVRIYREDKKVDQEYEGIVRQLMTYMMEDSRTIPSVLTALFCARSIERIGDRCQNICEYIFYFVKGQDFRHVGGDELDKLLAGKDPKE